jgi:hypothetical protein
MVKSAEAAFTKFLSVPLKFGAMRIDANTEEWRVVRPWPRMIADYIDSIMTREADHAETSDLLEKAMKVAVLVSDKLKLIDYHNFLLARRIFKGKHEGDHEVERLLLEKKFFERLKCLSAGKEGLAFISDAEKSFDLNLRFLEAQSSDGFGLENVVRCFSKKKRGWEVFGGCENASKKGIGFIPCSHNDVIPDWKCCVSQKWDSAKNVEKIEMSEICIVLPKFVADYLKRFKEFFDRHAPTNALVRTLQWQPVLIECKVKLDFKGRKITIKCDAVFATILSLFETPATCLRLSEIIGKTGVVGDMITAYMQELCNKRPGMSTGLLKVFLHSCRDALHFQKLTTRVLRSCARRPKTRPKETLIPNIVFTPSEHCTCNILCLVSHAVLLLRCAHARAGSSPRDPCSLSSRLFHAHRRLFVAVSSASGPMQKN